MDKIKVTIFLIFVMLSVVSCSSRKVLVETYQPVIKKLPQDHRYSKVTWSHLPKPIVPETETKGPYLKKVMTFDVPNSNVKESIMILAHSAGYEAIIPKELEGRRVSVVMDGTTIEILETICRQANISSEVDDKQRIIKVFNRVPRPKLY
ncbi:MAG: hypothetical protein LBE20_06835 [Deltaproteobacteria bacterium]|jgi:hypothetical protein|nr:hypothetical protein [Deltaproteobacteria bacterium]